MTFRKHLNSGLAASIMLGGATALLGARLFVLIYQKSVNILFWDQWDFLTPLFQQKTGWALFTWQHGPHRMGIGYFLIQLLAGWTGWNTRADAFASLALVVLALVAALFLKKRLFGSLSPWDVLIVALFLTATQYETFIGTPDESLAAFPLLLLILFCLAMTIDRPVMRLLAILVLNFLMIFTGFGLIIAPITLALVGFQLYQAVRRKSRPDGLVAGLVLLGSIGTILIFLQGYGIYPGVGCSDFHLSDLTKYPVFMSVMLAKFAGLDFNESQWAAILVGMLLLAVLIGVLAFMAFKLITGSDSNNQRNQSIAVLTGYSLLFSASASVGRICYGTASAQSSRYMTLVIPAFLGLYFFLMTLQKPPIRYLAVGVLALAVLLGQLPYRSNDQRIIEFFSTQKADWKACFLKTEDIAFCNQQTNFQIYPTIDARLISNLDYLKQNHLNLYLPDP
jgi:hypothetical protein